MIMSLKKRKNKNGKIKYICKKKVELKKLFFFYCLLWSLWSVANNMLLVALDK